MTLKTIAAGVAKNVGIGVPVAVLSSDGREDMLLVQFSQEAAQEVARRVDWSSLRRTAVLIGTGSNDDFPLPADFARLTTGMAVSHGGNPVRGGVSPDEWFALVPSEGAPRYFRLIGSAISLYPFPASGEVVSVQYQSKNWLFGRDTWGSDDDTALVPEELIQKGTVWRWKRHIGADYQDYLAEFEAALADFARFDDGARLP